ncbi:hypothetical protein SDJN03_10853, partial [Cucurbita argyrosperma subsp. sororia]
MLLERFKAIENLSSFRRGSEATEIAADSSTEIAQLAPPVSRLPILLAAAEFPIECFLRAFFSCHEYSPIASVVNPVFRSLTGGADADDPGRVCVASSRDVSGSDALWIGYVLHRLHDDALGYWIGYVFLCRRRCFEPLHDRTFDLILRYGSACAQKGHPSLEVNVKRTLMFETSNYCLWWLWRALISSVLCCAARWLSSRLDSAEKKCLLILYFKLDPVHIVSVKLKGANCWRSRASLAPSSLKVHVALLGSGMGKFLFFSPDLSS